MLVVTNRRLVKGDFKERLEMVSKADVDAVVLREKDWTREECESFLKRLSASDKIFVNNPNMRDYSCISVPFAEFEYNGDVKAIVSVHSEEEAKIAEKKGASALMVGHIFATDCKKGLPPRGLEFLSKVCSAVSIPVFAIGGIDATNARYVMEAGAFGCAVMSGAMTKDNVSEYLEKIIEIERIYRNKKEKLSDMASKLFAGKRKR